jgi:tetratricopeptide (TPR) repeat protein
MRFSRVFVVLISVALYSKAQPPKAGGSSGGTLGGSSSTGLGNNPSTANFPSVNSPNTANSSTNPMNSSRGEFFFGKVVMPDGTAPAIGAVIERVCNGNPRPMAYTDSNGNFSFQIGQTQEMLPDASETSTSMKGVAQPRTNSSQPYSCDLRAAVAGYRSELISLAGRRQDDPNVGTIHLHPYAKAEGLTMSATSALAPKDAHKAFEKGLEAMKKSKLDEAQTDFQKATEIYPRYAAAWLELGRVYQERDHMAEARDAYTKAIAADSKFIKPYEHLYLISFKEQNWEDLAGTTEKIMHLNPYDYPDAAYFNAVANSQLMKLDVAEKSARESLAMGNRNPKVYYILGVILAKKHSFTTAAECLRTYLKSDAVTDREAVKKLLADVEKQVEAKAQLKSEQ